VDPTPDDAPPDVVVTDNPAAHRFEVRVGGELAGLTTYVVADNRVIFTHAEVYPRHEGHGVGSTLARAALDDVIARGMLITPSCPFIRDFVQHHPSYQEHVAPPL